MTRVPPPTSVSPHRILTTPANDGDLAVISGRFPAALHRRLKLWCIESGVTLQTAVTAAIREQLERESRTPPPRRRSRGRAAELAAPKRRRVGSSTIATKRRR